MNSAQAAVFLDKHVNQFSNVVDFDFKADKLLEFDFTSRNTALSQETLADTNLFSKWVDEKLKSADARYGIGGYNEHRTIYNRSAHFDTQGEPRRLHLGVDIWGPAGTPIYNFWDATVHSFAYNDNFGDYGATIILEYQIEDLKLYGLYGHLSKSSINKLSEKQFVAKGKHFASFGVKEENGNWPPHLHFQLMLDMQGFKGDYPGVCQFSKRDEYLSNCPNPMLILANTFSSNA